ncbi:hypothetical protein [Adlercreutzia sp. ZJ242]|uniref:hypothetical protein n=1 Tax=Adlercreutzia sp. ZJ242 TaxID=2709409 RepID=UPI0013EA821D|nr:hypothetical protein [Adlercreutzia sp. ZJ242]
MAKIGLIKGFRNLEVGKEQTLLIKKVSYEEKYMKCKITFSDAEDRTLTEQFSFKGKKKGTLNEVALGIFSTIAKCATHDFTDREIDPEEIEGLYVVADVYEQEVKDEDENVTGTYKHIRNFKEADVDFEEDADEDIDDIDDYL